MIERFLSAAEMACASFAATAISFLLWSQKAGYRNLPYVMQFGRDEPVVETIIGGRPWAAMVQPMGISSARGTARWTCRTRPFSLDLERNGASRSVRTAMEIRLVPSLRSSKECYRLLETAELSADLQTSSLPSSAAKGSAELSIPPCLLRRGLNIDHRVTVF